ncbi:STM2901 family protein [Kosakonia oryzae]|uniref:Uncharacterized protein n=1 Tax=Kosakonia oryzae TaxID=497725 RepID=A0AA94H1Q0_9ENTR|nr:hypothetical protein [Kosakonia oryzae]ANI83277.1 hypothetical protein AWR26_14345 [Kosakonia oryzae]SFC03950.1 hypothetical protein SAMN05216286_1386 [Kosakonia oryzae]
MDTVEELNGTYFYHGHTNVSAGELFNLIFLENFADSFGLDVASAAMVLIGQPYIPVSGKLAAGQNTPGTSIASIVSRKILRDARFPFGWRPLAPVGKLRSLKMVPSNKIATFVGRYIPYVGYAMALVAVQQVMSKTRTQYNLIARPQDRIKWTYF